MTLNWIAAFRAVSVMAVALAAQPVAAQDSDPGFEDRVRDLENRTGASRTVFASVNELLFAGAESIRYGRYEEGIRLTQLGLERPGNTSQNQAAGLSNLCAAYAAVNNPDAAIDACTLSLEITEHNWQAWSNRSYAFWLKSMYDEAASDLQRAMQINTQARQLGQLRGMLNEAGLVPRVVTEDRQ